MYEEIPTADLRPEHLPAPDADWADIRTFALTFDGYTYVLGGRPGDSTGLCSDLANRVRDVFPQGEEAAAGFSLDDLRAALFWWQRVVRWSETEVPDEETLAHCRELVECTRDRVARGDPGGVQPRAATEGPPNETIEGLPVSSVELERLVERCRALPPSEGDYSEDDYIRNLFLTVLDIRMKVAAVNNALGYYCDNRWDEVRTLDQLNTLLREYPDNKEGNTALAQYLWGTRHWTRIGILRRLVSFFEGIGVTSQEALRDWARASDFKQDFEAKVSGLGFAAYQALRIRQGDSTLKPDVHLRRFVKEVTGIALGDAALVDLLTRVASELGLPARELDRRIWEYQRGKLGGGV